MMKPGSFLKRVAVACALLMASGYAQLPARTTVSDTVYRAEPQAYVTDYFVGDGATLRFNLSQTPFSRTSSTVLDEEWIGTAPSPLSWSTADPAAAVSINQGKLQVNGREWS